MNQPPAPTDLHRLLRIAKNQRAIMLCILAQLAVYGAALFIPLPLVSTILSLLVGIASIVFIIGLARGLYSMVGVVTCVVFLTVPIVGIFFVPAVPLRLLSLLTLVVVNQRATKELRAAGFKVGLMGGDPAEVEGRLRAGAV